MSARKRLQSDPFTDLLFNALLGFTFLFLVAIMFMNPEAKTGIIDPKAEYIITVTWEDNNPDDIDTETNWWLLKSNFSCTSTVMIAALSTIPSW